MAAAILPQSSGPEVTIRPLGLKPTLFIDPAMQPADAGGAGPKPSSRRSPNG